MVTFKNLFKKKDKNNTVLLLTETVKSLANRVKLLEDETTKLKTEVDELKRVKQDDNAVDAQQVMDEYFMGEKGDYR